MNVHTCHALGCEVRVPPRLHMCARHWRMVPRQLQRALWAEYRVGQERSMTPSVEYLRVAAMCVRSVAEQENWTMAEIDAECELYETWATMLEAE